MKYRLWLYTTWWPSRLRYLAKNELSRRLALLLPRSVAMHAFIRVYGNAMWAADTPDFDTCLNEWAKK